MNRRTARGFRVAVAACSLLALAALIVPSSARVDTADFDTVGLVDGAVTGVLPAMPWDRDPYWRIVEGNPFSPARQGPEPDAAPWTLPASSASRTTIPSPAAVPARVPQYRLSGIVQGPDGVAALIDADPRVPGAEIYRIGDPVGPFRLTEATDSTVVLAGPAGTQVLRLRRVPGSIP